MGVTIWWIFIHNLLRYNLTQSFSTHGLWTNSWTWPGNVLEMQIFDPPTQKYWITVSENRLQQSGFKKPSRLLWCFLKLENHFSSRSVFPCEREYWFIARRTLMPFTYQKVNEPEKVNEILGQGFSTTGTIDILGRIIFCCNWLSCALQDG